MEFNFKILNQVAQEDQDILLDAIYSKSRYCKKCRDYTEFKLYIDQFPASYFYWGMIWKVCLICGEQDVYHLHRS